MDRRQVRMAARGFWVGYLVTGILVVVAYYFAVHFHSPPVVLVVLYCLVSASAAVAVLVAGARVEGNRTPWLFLGASQVVYASADICFYTSHNILGDTAFPALADPLYLGHYPLVVVGLILLIRSRTPGKDLPSLLDAATVAVAAAMLSWLFLIAPQARADSPTLVKLASVGYPVMDLAMFAVALRLILGPGRRPTSFVLLVVNLLAIFTADTLYVIQQLNGTYQTGNFLDAIWLGGNLALGAAALHPTASQVTERASAEDVRLTPVRLALLAGAALIAPATLLALNMMGTLRDVPVIAGACAALFLFTIARLAGLVVDQRHLAITDVLTGLRTRRFFGSQLPLELTKARRAGSSLAVLIVDVDHFKSINDRYGHPAGDRVLVEVARRLRESVRHADFIARYGGEEFALVVPEIGPQELASIGERLRNQVAASPICVSPDIAIEVTVSVGTAGYPRHGKSPAELITTADRALYAAKSQGRDRVVVGETITAGLVPASPNGSTVDLLSYLQRTADEVDSWLSGKEHGRAVGRWAALVASALGEDESVVRRAELAGRLHDIGKIMVPQAIWRKPSALSRYERQLAQQHCDYGYQLVCVVPGLLDVADVVRQHHERIDGRGYPLALTGPEIRLEAKIVAVCDSWAAMIADRPYHTALLPDEACEELMAGRGSQFDGDVVDAFVDLHRRGLLGALRGLAEPVPVRVTP
ncbi:MAG TPA: diguanylate cyclase [Pseudonocardiaceae bacterium]|nr:diguanylate cyclase [Pseudonocardiaceae bacterium]